MVFLHDNTTDLKNYKHEDKSIILKRVKSIRQLRNSEKELVRNCYRGAILRGFTSVMDIQNYIVERSKIFLEKSGIENLQKSQEYEDRKWYYYMAKDHFAYISVYRKACDEMDQYKKELWSMIIDLNTTNLEKVQILRELHNMTKTSTLLLRDLPFVTNLTRYYNLDSMSSDSQKNIQMNKAESEKLEKEIIEQKVSERLSKMIDESALFTSEQKYKMGMIGPTDGNRKVTDCVMKDIQKQLDYTANDFLELINNKDYQEAIKKIEEIRED